MIVNDQTFVSIAKRHMNGILPLYYEMSVAGKQDIDYESIYSGLIHAFNANIGIISNDITKVWNSDNPNLDVIKYACMESNFTIDYAKTLFKPSRPRHVDKKIKSFTKEKVPHFFQYAKDKPVENVAEINNSVVNRLDKLIPNGRISFRKIAGKMDYRYLMKNPKTIVNQSIVKKYNELNRNKKWLIGEYDNRSGDTPAFNKLVRVELLKIHNDIHYIVDVLVKHLYYEKNSRSKSILWNSFEDIVYQNLYHNTKKTIICESCGDRVKSNSNRRKYCDPCAKKVWNASRRKSKKDV